ncbi:MAG: hypothetical protein WCN81_14030 [Actinomycetes bacterium]
MAAGHRYALATIAVFVLLCGGAAAALTLTAAPAAAFDGWGHDGVSQCLDCHNGRPLDDQICTACHAGFKSFPGRQCWSCHVPGEDTAALSTPSAACSRGCHLWDEAVKVYSAPFTHGETPHDGAAGYGKTCLDCHETSVSVVDPGGSPHHSGVETPPPTCTDCHNGTDAVAQATHDGNPCTSCHSGMDIPSVPATCNQCHPAGTFGSPDCLKCHAAQVHNAEPQPPACADCHGDGYQRHAGKVACLTCHTGIAAFHHGQSKTVTQRDCRSCHAKKHAGQKVPQSRCAACHAGSGTGPALKAQHSATVTKSSVCSTCHAKKLHASSLGSGITSCATCHRGKYHAAQKTPSNSVCTACHGSAARHANGYGCGLCHRSQIHNARPAVPKIRP